MSPPRKPRSPGQRQFNPMGTPRDWQRVAKQPGVKRMLRDPQLANALYQNFRQTGGQMPQQAAGMADGGGIPTPEDLNRLAQIRGGDIDPYSGNQLQELAEESRPTRFQSGGSVTDEDVTQAYNDWQKELRANDPQAAEAARQKYMSLSQRRASQTPSQASPVSLGPNQQVSAGTMTGLKQLGQAGPPTTANIVGSTLAGALAGGAGTGSGAGALIGGATAGLLNYFIRSNAQKKRQQQQQQQPQQQEPPQPPQQPQQQSNAANVNNAVGSYNPNATTTGSGGTANPAGPAPQPGLMPQLQSGPGLWSGSANVAGGSVISSDGKTWVNQQTGRPVDPSTTPIANVTQLKGYDQAPASGSSDLTNLPVNTNPANLPAAGTGLGALDETALESDSLDSGLARGGPVPEGRPAPRMLLPVLHTTIVIAAKPKKNSKDAGNSMGGHIPQALRRPRRPHAIPPIAGPESSGVRLPHGRVQVPRGSGSAIKGKRFGGIY